METRNWQLVPQAADRIGDSSVPVHQHFCFFFSSRRRHTRFKCDWSSGRVLFRSEIRALRDIAAGIVYVDIWDGFVDESGRYVTQGPDFEGQIRRLRTGDGVHFTKAGAVKLAQYVAQDLRRVISSHVVPVALPAPEGAPAKPGAGPRPAVGPVLPLTADTSVDGNNLLGDGGRTAPATADPMAVRVLTHRDPLAAPSARAAHFSSPPRRRAAH